MRDKFICPACGERIKSRVLDTKPCYNGFKRYRVCEQCDAAFVTMEKVAHITKGKWRKALGE